MKTDIAEPRLDLIESVRRRFPILQGLEFYLAGEASKPSLFLMVGRWSWVGTSKLCARVEWEGKEELIQVNQDCRYGVLESMHHSASLVEALCDGDIVLLELVSEESLLFLRRVEVLTPNLESTYPQQLGLDRLSQLKKWSRFKRSIWDFFVDNHFLEIETPSLVPCPGTEPYLDPIGVDTKRPLFLPTSPEIHLKKALSQGISKLFEIKPCFRGDEIGQHHQPEFLMLEWYRSFGTLTQIHDDLQKLICFLSESFGGGEETKIEVVTVAELFQTHCAFELNPDTSAEELNQLCRQFGLSQDEKLSWDDAFFLLFLERIECVLSQKDHPVLVCDYPPQLAAYSRINDQGWAGRFELYWRGLEIANAFQELNDFNEQQRRFQQDLAKKSAIGKLEVPLDPQFNRALRSGLPPSAGIALGVERLYMAMTGIRDIREIKLFPYNQD